MEQYEIREPQVAGSFYPSSKQQLIKQIESFIDKKSEKTDCLACMLPHAGYIYSGAVAGGTLSRVNIKDKVILLGPNHTGYGKNFSIMSSGVWRTPLGQVAIDNELADNILSRSKYLQKDSLAHLYEHSLEVELPFLQYFKTDFKIVPISFLSENFTMLKEIGKEIASVLQDSAAKNSTLIVASSDMTHYESQLQAQKKDKEATDCILQLDEDSLIKKIKQLDISMCGYAPVVVMLSLAKALGAKKGELVKYQTSGDVTGDTSSVVGYAGIIIY